MIEHNRETVPIPPPKSKILLGCTWEIKRTAARRSLIVDSSDSENAALINQKLL
ncbi:MAG: hypothetical protein ACYTX0_39670 [Nostoc sp.]